MRRKSKKTPFFVLHLLAVILIVGVAVGVLGFSRLGATKAKTSGDEANWSRFGYKIEYPSNLKLVDGRLMTDLFFPTDRYFRTSMIREAELELLPGAAKCDSFAGHVTGVQKMSVDGLNMEKKLWRGAAAGNIFEGIDYDIRKDGLCYQLRLFTHSRSRGDVTEPLTQNAAEVHSEDMRNLFVVSDYIASTFRFTSF